MNLSFAGCGFLGIYHVGVSVCFKKYAPHLLLDKISGASAGALAACCLLCDLPLGFNGALKLQNRAFLATNQLQYYSPKNHLREMTSDFFRVVNEARSHSLGPFSPSFNIQTTLLEGLSKHLPADAHLRVNGRLHISLTRVYDGKNVIVSHYNSREDLLQALLCACFIPVFSGILPPRFHGVRYMDGAFSDNLPTLDENTITVSPFCGESDICPRDQSSQLFHVNWANTSIELSKQNINRFGRILFPSKPEILSNMCQQGFDDALSFLHRNNLISCTRCLAVQSTFIVSESLPDVQDYDPECKECTEHRNEAKEGNMPETVLTVFQTYIESANKGLANWVFRHRGAKLIQALSLPATLPADFVCATLTKIMMAAPSIRNQLWHVSKYVLGQLNTVLKSRTTKRPPKMTANLSCQLALTEYGQQLPHSLHSQHRNSHQIDLLMDDNTMAIKDLVQAAPNPAGDVDNFEHILQVTSHQEAVYAYYYMDENNKVKVTEIFDMTDNENPSLQTTNERELNQQLEFDSEWDTNTPDYMYGGDELPDICYNSNMIEMGDPDDFDYDIFNSSPYHSEVQIEEIPSDSNDDYFQPEADQTSFMSESTTKALLRQPQSFLEL